MQKPSTLLELSYLVKAEKAGKTATTQPKKQEQEHPDLGAIRLSRASHVPWKGWYRGYLAI